MPLRIITGNLIVQNATAVTITGSTAFLIVAQGAVVASEGISPADGVRITGSNHQIFIDGTVAGGYGLYYDSTDTYITVGANGRIFGAFSAISNVASAATIINSGWLRGGVIGLDTATACRIENDGIIEGGAGSVSLSAGADELINSGLLRGTARLDDGNDHYDGRGGRVEGLIDLGGGNDTAFGGDWADRFSDGTGADEIDGGAGDDTFEVSADKFADTFDGGAGVDTLRFLSAGTAAVTVDLRTGEARSALTGTDSFTSIERVLGGNGSDRLTGDNVANTLFGGTGNDTLAGNGGDDRLFGGLGINMLTGGDGNDRLIGDSGRDTMFGGNGDDYIWGSYDTENMAGGTGADTFVWRDVDELFVVNAGSPQFDRITDFTPGLDRIDLSSIDPDGIGNDGAFTFRGMAGLTDVAQVAIRQVGGFTYVDISWQTAFAASSIRLDGLLTLTAADFVL